MKIVSVARASKEDKIAVLLLAREKLASPYGWIKGKMYSPKRKGGGTAYCLHGACNSASNELGIRFTVGGRSQPTADALSLESLCMVKHKMDIIPFNDGPAKKKDILELIDLKLEELGAKP